MTSGSRDRLFAIARVAIGMSLIAVVLSRIDGRGIASSMLANAWLWPVVALVPFAGGAVEAARLGLLLRSQSFHLPFATGYRLVAVSTFFGFCLPGGTGGDVVKLYYLRAPERRHTVELATVLVLDRVIGLHSLLLLVAVLGAVNRELLQDLPLLRGLFATAMLLLAGLSAFLVVASSRSIARNRWLEASLSGTRIHGWIVRASDALFAFRSRRRALVGAVSVSLLGHLLLAVTFLLIGWVVVPQAGRVVVFLSLLGLLANAIPFTPGGLGVGEAAFQGLFGVVGWNGGGLLMLAWRVSIIPFCLFGGALYMKGVRGRAAALPPGAASECATDPEPARRVTERA